MTQAQLLTLARYYARKLVRDELQRQGRRLQTITALEINQLATARLAEGMRIAQNSTLVCGKVKPCATSASATHNSHTK